MPAIYTRAQKLHALYLIDELGSVTAVSRKLNIPARTLRDWRITQRYRDGIPSTRHAITDYTGSDGHPTDIRTVRDRLLTHIDTLTANLPTEPRDAYYSALALDKHLAQLAELNRAIGVEPPVPAATDRFRRDASEPLILPAPLPPPPPPKPAGLLETAKSLDIVLESMMRLNSSLPSGETVWTILDKKKGSRR